MDNAMGGKEGWPLVGVSVTMCLILVVGTAGIVKSFPDKTTPPPTAEELIKIEHTLESESAKRVYKRTSLGIVYFTDCIEGYKVIGTRWGALAGPIGKCGAVVDTEAPLVDRTFHLFKTGAVMPDDILDNYLYLGCGAIFVQMQLMMYLFEKIGQSESPHTPVVNDFDWKKVQES